MLTRAWQMLLKGLDEVRLAPNPLDAADMLLVRLAHASTLPTPEDALRVLQGEALPEIAQGAPSGPQRVETPAPSPKPVSGPSPGDTGDDAADAMSDLRHIYDLANRAKNIRLAQALWSDGRLADVDGRHVKVAGLDTSLARDLQSKLKEWTGETWTIEPVSEADAPTLKERDEARRRAEIEAVKSDPNVAAVLDAFPDAEVEAVLEEEDEDR